MSAVVTPPLVIDASVAVKWLFPEVGDDAAQSLLLADAPLVAPSQIVLEVAGAILRRHRDETITTAKAREVLTEWRSIVRDGPITITRNEVLIEEAIELSLEMRHPLPDCLYLALAARTNATVATFDRKLHLRGGERVRTKFMASDHG
jgi:predicted nucleic acid-binding protein